MQTTADLFSWGVGPQSARLRFRLRLLTNVLLTAGISMLLIWFFSRWFDFLLVDVLVGIGAFYLYFFILEKRPIRIRCPECLKYIETNTPWICGNKQCGYQNNRADDFPFIYKCEKCGYSPKAYQCHHKRCGKPIFFSKDEQESGMARSANVLVPEKRKAIEIPPVSDFAKVKEEIKDQIEVTRLKVEKAKLDLELKDQERELAPPKTMEEIYRGLVKNDTDALRLHAYIDEEFKNDEATRKKHHQLVEGIRLNLLR